jgi:hypothetical protein
MTVRADTFEMNSESWSASPTRSVQSNAVVRILEWWRGRSVSLTMSEEWLQEHRRSTRSY